MANTEVGAAYVSILPSLKGFTKSLQRELKKELNAGAIDKMLSDAFTNARVRLPVEPVVDDVGRLDPVDVPVRADRSALDDLRDDVERIAEQTRAVVAVGPDGTTFGRLLREEVDRADDGVRARVGTDVDTGGLLARLSESVRAASRSVVARVRVEFDRERLDVDVRDAIGRIHVDAEGRQLGSRLAAGAGESLQGGISSALSSVVNNPVVSTLGIGLGVGIAGAFAPVAAATIGSAIGAAIIGGTGLGLIGAAALILKNEPEFVSAAESLKEKFSSTLRDAAEPLLKPFVAAMGAIEQLLTDIAPDLKSLFAVFATPDENGTTAISALTEALAGFVKGALPGLTEMAKAAVPLLKDLASTLPRLGQDVGDFFSLVSEGGPGASTFLRDLINISGLALITFGQFISYAGQVYSVLRATVDDALEVLRQAVVGWGYIVEDVGDFFQHLGAIIAAVWRTVRYDTGAVVDFFAGIPRRILRALGNLGDLLRNAGRSIIQGLINGIRGMVPSLSGTLGWITNMIPDWKGPMDTDRRLLEPSGTAIMGGLIRGIHGERRALETELGSVTTLISGTPLTSPAAGFGASAPVAPAPRLTAEWIGNGTDPLTVALKENIRISYGGDPVFALGS
ncbi:hypothetical protein ACFP2T_15335 [Plantactinospora solaniradicis]|uniref:Phage-related protein n=1 Tax=Plantactinospora solaniradicis TaxID=1723736 RepID=A0ABW1K783_9ACTN